MAIGLGVAILLILLPRAIEGDYYEVIDPLVFMGVPLVVIGAAIGALIGAPGPRAVTGDLTTPSPRPSTSGRLIVGVVSIGSGALAIWLLLWAIGAVGPAPLGLW
jgi:hypothetical protein